jgi:lysozyme
MKKLFLLIVGLVFANAAVADDAVNFLKNVEGAVTRNGYHIVYDDANPKVRWNGVETFNQFKKRCSGKPTIGYGFTAKNLVSKCQITQAEADAELARLVKLCRIRLYKTVKIQLNKNQETALISFIFNVGGANFAESTLAKKLNNNDFIGSANEFARWKYTTVKGKKVVSKGLINRRAKEKTKFLSK